MREGKGRGIKRKRQLGKFVVAWEGEMCIGKARGVGAGGGWWWLEGRGLGQRGVGGVVLVRGKKYWLEDFKGRSISWKIVRVEVLVRGLWGEKC